MKKYFVFFLCFVFSSFQFINSSNNSTKELEINLISQEDQAHLDLFFKTLLFDEGGIYTLMGDKPVSIGYFLKTFPFSITHLNNCDWSIFSLRPMGTFWNSWKKNRHLFKSKNYMLFEEENYKLDYVSFIILLNKRAFIKKVDEHLETFKNILGNDISGKSLLKQVIEGTPLITECLRKSELLLGILLGYGGHNASLFDIRNTVLLSGNKLFPLDYPEDAFSPPFSNMGSLEKGGHFPKKFALPVFSSERKHPETIKLREKYNKQRAEIIKELSQKSHMEIVFKQLVE